jgi:hypothetical protein
MSNRRLEEGLDELLWHVAAEGDSGDERVRADVSRWLKTRAEVSTLRRAASPWLRAAAVVLALGGVGAAGYWESGFETPPGDSESWYVQVARAPDSGCTSDSWYCVQARLR